MGLRPRKRCFLSLFLGSRECQARPLPARPWDKAPSVHHFFFSGRYFFSIDATTT